MDGHVMTMMHRSTLLEELHVDQTVLGTWSWWLSLSQMMHSWP